MELLRQSTQQFVDNFINNNELTTNINSLWADFHSFVISAQDIYVPSKWSSIRYTQPWFTTDCKKLVRKKKKLYCKAKKSNQNADWQAFKDTVVKTRKACREAYNIFINNCLDKNNNSNSKRLFSYIKSKQIDNIGVAPLKDNGLVYINGHDKARILNSQFVNVFSIDKGDIPQIHAKYAENPMNNFNINSEGIIKLLNQLNSNKACGPDNISGRFLKELSTEISTALALIFNASLHQQKIPDDWRKAVVTPIYKQGKKDRSKAENYRPISLTSIPCKILEHIIHSNVMDH